MRSFFSDNNDVDFYDIYVASRWQNRPFRGTDIQRTADALAWTSDLISQGPKIDKGNGEEDGDKSKEDGKQVFRKDDGVVFRVANRQQGEKDARACLHAYRHTDPLRRDVYFVPEGTILNPALTLSELSRRAGGVNFGFSSVRGRDDVPVGGETPGDV